jgi:putative hydrolase of the HAD superfamily
MKYPLNIVFDIGNVICEWNPQKLVASVFAEAEDRHLALTNIIGHNDWLMLDKGTLPLEDAISRGAARSGLHQDEVAKLFEETPKSLVPFASTVEVISTLKERQFNLFVLSNMHDYAFEYLLAEYAFWDNFSGIVISSSIKAIKPEPEIFQYLLKRHNLMAEETLFLDDLETNIQAARSHGIQALLVKDPGQIKQSLFEILDL